MFPSKLSRRAAVMSGLMAGTFALALAASPAQAVGTPTAGQACPPLLSAATLAKLDLKCVGNVLTTLVPIPTSAPSLPSLPLPAPKTTSPTSPPSSAAPNPLASLASGVTSTVNGLSSAVASAGAPVTNAINNAVNSLLGGSLPSATPSTPAGTLPGGTSGTGTGVGSTGVSTGTKGGTAKAGSPLTTAAKAPSTKDGSSLLGPAAAFLPGASLADFADLNSSYGPLLPLADNIPSPLIASAEGKLEAVQAPLIAAGQKAASQADSGLFSRFGGKALPGILVVIATAMVAAVGAGNLRAFQARFGSVGNIKLRAWKRSAK